MEEAKKKPWGDPRVEEAHNHFKTAREAFWKSAEAFLPAGFIENRRKARKEILLGLRSLLDAAIEHSEKHEEGA